jgi:UDP-3-O-[3-hydroxymyristoyl] glucosamine N-acyltransferase
MIFPKTQSNYYAISFDSSLFKDLQSSCLADGVELQRISVEDFLAGSIDANGYYINLVTRETSLRAEISARLDQENIPRFSYVSPFVLDLSNTIKEGSAVWPWVTIVANATIDKDFICMGHASIGHNSRIGQGAILSPSVVVSGSVDIGKFCYLRTRSTILEKVTLGDHVEIGAKSLIRKNVLTSGKWITNSKGVLKRVGNAGSL